MRTRKTLAWVVGLLALLSSAGLVGPASAGDALYGTVTEVKSAEVVVLDYGAGRYDVRIVGIDVPKEGPVVQAAKQLVTSLVLGKKVRIRFEQRNQSGEMVSRLFVGDPGMDVGVELLKAGLARRQPRYDYKYGELAAAENEARNAKRGLWATDLK